MKKVFRKITKVAAGVLIAGLTTGLAAAASFPAPFVDDGAADVAIVYGTGEGVSSLDMVHAGNIQTTLGEFMPSTGSSVVTGGEVFLLDKTSNHFNFGNALNAVYSDLDDEQMPVFLADGTYDDGDIDEEYEQTINLGTKTLSLFADTDYDNDAPTVGFYWTNAEEVLNYVIDYDEVLNYTLMVGTDMPIMGQDYYVLAASSTQIDVLDTDTARTKVTEGETVTLNGHTVGIYSIDSDSIRFTVDGVNVDDEMSAEGDYEEYADDEYIVLHSFTYDTRDGRDSYAEISLGNGKMELISGEEIELNGEDIDGLESTIGDSTGLDTLTLTWKSDRETFLTASDAIIMPGFESIKLVYGGLNMPSDYETISVDNGETLTLSMDNFDDFPVAWWDGTDAFLGEEDYPLITATSTANYTSPAANFTGGLDLVENDRFIVTNIGTDLSDVETMYYEVNTVENDSGTISVELIDLIGDNDITYDQLESHDRGVLTAELTGVNGSVVGASAYIEFTSSDATVYYNKVVSDTGMVVTLPTDVSSVDTSTAAKIYFTEADDDDDITEGHIFSVDFKATSNDKLHVSTHNLTAYDEEETDDNYVGYVPSDLATKLMFDTSADEYDFSLDYYGTEVTADVSVASSDAVVTSSGASALGDVLVTDAEIATVSGQNVIIVGGSCINSAAATLLGGNYCGPSFTTQTGVGAGQFLIQSFGDAFTTDKIALLVAGYNVDDTVNAATYLRTQDVDTMAGNKYIGTTSSEATLQVA